MGQEKKYEEEKQEEEDEEVAPPEIVLKVDMHCEACARKLARALKGFQGVENVSTDSKDCKVVVKVKTADPQKVCERLQRKSGRKVEIISPLPNPPHQDNQQEPSQDKNEELPAVVTVVLNVRMHCEACAQVLRKRVGKIKVHAMMDVQTNRCGISGADLGNSQVTVKGVVDPSRPVDEVYKKTRKQAWIVKDGDEKKQEEATEQKQEGAREQQKQEAATEQKEEENKEQQEDEKMKGTGDHFIKRSEYWPSKLYLEYAYAP